MNTKFYILIALVLFFFSPVAYGETSIILQPGPSDGIDAFTDPTASYRDTNIGADILLLMTDTSTIDDGYQSFIKLDLPTINGTLLSANYKMHIRSISHGYGGPHPVICNLDRIEQAWAEDTITYNNRPSSSTTIQSHITMDENFESGWASADITDFVTFWLDNPSLNYGFVISVSSSTGAAVFADSSDYQDSNLRPIWEFNVQAVPEPSAIFLFGILGVPLLLKKKE